MKGRGSCPRIGHPGELPGHGQAPDWDRSCTQRGTAGKLVQWIWRSKFVDMAELLKEEEASSR